MPMLSKLKTVRQMFNRYRTVTQDVTDAIEVADDLEEDATTAAHIADDVENVTRAATPPLKAGADIPAEPLPELKPVAEAVEAIDKVVNSTIKPGLNTVAKLLGTITVLLAPILHLLSNRKGKDTALATSFDNAVSVNDQIVAKFGDEPPSEMLKATKTLDSAVSAAAADLDQVDGVITKIESALATLEPMKEINKLITPIMRAIKPIEQKLGSLISKSSKLMGPLNNAIAAFVKWKDGALSKIESSLKKSGIDISFINRIEAEIKKAETTVLNSVLSPVKKLEAEATSKLGALEKPINNLEAQAKTIVGTISRAIDPVKELLDEYVAEAAKIGIHPK